MVRPPALQSTTDWVKLNAGQTGFFRVQYPLPLWGSLIRAAGQVSEGEPALPAIDFAGLLDDAWALNLAGRLPIHVFLNLTRWGHCHTARLALLLR